MHSLAQITSTHRCVHPDPAFVAAANAAHAELGELMQELNTHRGLYSALVAAMDAAKGGDGQPSAFDEEQVARVTHAMLGRHFALSFSLCEKAGTVG
jgi:Zn-dependent oligopeptidase